MIAVPEQQDLRGDASRRVDVGRYSQAPNRFGDIIVDLGFEVSVLVS